MREGLVPTVPGQTACEGVSAEATTPSRTFSFDRETRRGVLRDMIDDDAGVFVIRADPIERPQPDGGVRISVGFPVLIVTGWVGKPDEFAARVATLLQEAGM